MNKPIKYKHLIAFVLISLTCLLVYKSLKMAYFSIQTSNDFVISSIAREEGYKDGVESEKYNERMKSYYRDYKNEDFKLIIN